MYCGRKQITDCLRVGEGGEKGIRYTGAQEDFGVTEMFIILIVVIVPCLKAFAKTHQLVPF